MIATGSTARATVKQRKCKAKGCKALFWPGLPMQKVCGPLCAAKLAIDKRAAKSSKEAAQERKEVRKKLESLKSLAQLSDAAQQEVNRYVRLRDAHLGCVSCDKGPSWAGQWHASHLRSRGAAPGLRFHLWNIHKACSVCNNHLSGNLAEYRPRLESRIGADKVAWLYNQNEPIKRNRDYLLRVRSVFKRKADRIERRAK